MSHISYPVGDFLIRIKNASRAYKHEVSAPYGKLLKSVADVLKKEGFLSEVEHKKGELTVKLTYKRKEPILMDVTLVSKPGLRIYLGADELKSRRGASILILSTSKGVMSSHEAAKEGVGGEIIAEIL